MLNILSWNIRQGGGTRVPQICKVLADLSPEVIVLSEFRNNQSGALIRGNLLKAGYRYHYVTAAKTNDNSAAIFSKIAGDAFLYPNSDKDFPHNVLACEYDAFIVYGMYLPHKKKHLLFDFLIEEVKGEKPAILVGDFNTGKNYIDQKGNSFWYEDKLIALEKLGQVDAFRAMNGEVKEYSWFSHQKNGYRYDHTYVDKNLIPIVKSCHYLHEWREEGLSDHSPMLLQLG